jgi:hypothetical protein
LTHGHATACDPSRKCGPGSRIGNGEKGAAVSGREASILKEILDRFLELEEADGVCNRRAVLARAIGNLILCEAEFIGQALERSRLLNGIQVFSLEVLDQSHLEGQFFGNDSQHGGDTGKAGPLRSAPAPLASYQLETGRDSSHDEGLNDAACSD